MFFNRSQIIISKSGSCVNLHLIDVFCTLVLIVLKRFCPSGEHENAKVCDVPYQQSPQSSINLVIYTFMFIEDMSNLKLTHTHTKQTPSFHLETHRVMSCHTFDPFWDKPNQTRSSTLPWHYLATSNIQQFCSTFGTIRETSNEVKHLHFLPAQSRPQVPSRWETV